MNVLVINGSPKGESSNTYRLTGAFLDGMKREAQDMQIRELSVSRMDIKPCLGCFSCWNRTPGQCCIQDDMKEVMQDLLWADVTIWSFPLYYYSVPGPLKNLIDRQLPMMLPFMVEKEGQVGSGSHPSRYDMSGKRTVVISTCGFYTAEGNYDGIYSLFDHLCGKGNYTTVLCGQGELFRVPELSARTDEYLSYVKQAGQEFLKGGISEKTRETLDQLLLPKETFEACADASWGITPNKKDGGSPEKKESDTLIFTRQMAALYRKENYPGHDIVLEMKYTDVEECYQILLGKDGSRVYTDGSLAADTTIETPVTVWRAIAAGEIRGDEAMMQGLYQVKGDFTLMLKWDSYFSGSRSQIKQEKTFSEQRDTNMNIMLIPWIALWIAPAINRQWGCLIVLGVCALVPLFFYRNRKTFYDILTNVLVSGASIAMLAGGSEKWLLPLSYLSFGVMWAASCLGKVPLTANYSMNDYGGGEALQNALFLKTNRILTMIWGVLYLVTSVFTWFLMRTSISSFVGLINSILPVLMGIFTAWFQKWYPAKVAGGK
ncbi:MAG: NAD(P)H-dependent oxidoreductase [Bacteroidales bacterium]|nr:NAD(P)H-dependent oxidoreductase [Bacteroidales bacterium]MCM1415084.1 NAD(P)H-dependent oxidoreductase [bacterium]MCM1424391.1 NAD(P)H-dependent oxidoreductase [bacterium]